MANHCDPIRTFGRLETSPMSPLQTRPTRLEAAEARPFIKWAGGKSQLLDQFQPLFPPHFSRFLEPFLGSGAVFFRLHPETAFLSDINPELYNAYLCVRDSLEETIAVLSHHKRHHSTEYYYKVRASRTPTLTPPQRAARFIYLNKTCFNGLYRVNSQGLFNVPVGRYENPPILDQENLRAVSRVLQETQLFNLPFDVFCRRFAKPGDFVYFDPPYQPLSKTANFTGYTKDCFSLADQSRLRDLFIELDQRGCLLMLSNSYCPEILGLYKRYAATTHTVLAKRAISCMGAQRGAIKELVVLNYAPISN